MERQDAITRLKRLLADSPLPLWIDIETTDIEEAFNVIREATDRGTRYRYVVTSAQSLAKVLPDLLEESIDYFFALNDDTEEDDDKSSEDEDDTQLKEKLKAANVYVLSPHEGALIQVIFFMFAFQVHRVIITFNANVPDWLKDNAVRIKIDSPYGYLPSSAYHAYSRVCLSSMSLRTEILKKHKINIMEPVSEDELGGWDLFKEYIQLLASYKESDDDSILLKGVLLLGIPGTGKSLAAKVVGSYFDWPIINFSLGDLLSQYVGESEHRLQRFLNIVEKLSPVVLYIDEIEKMFHSSIGDPVTPRLLGTLLSWLQDVKEDVFVVATANAVLGSSFTAPLPPELLRHGRFNKHFFADVPPFKEKLKILEVFFWRYDVPIEVSDLNQTKLEKATRDLTGAELEEAVKNAKMLYIVKGGNFADHLYSSLSEVVPIVHFYDEYVNKLRAFARTRFLPVSRYQQKALK